MKDALNTKKLFPAFLAVGFVAASFSLVKPAEANVSVSSSINVENNVSSEGSSSVSVKQSVTSTNNVIISRNYYEENGQVIEDSRKVIPRRTRTIYRLQPTPTPTPKLQATPKPQVRADQYSTKLRQIALDTDAELEDLEARIKNEAEEKIRAAREEAERRAEEANREAEQIGTVEAELQRQWEEQQRANELSFWERMRAWINEKISGLR